MDLKSLTLNEKTYDRFMPVVDTALAESGKAADAKAAGDAIALVQKAVADLMTDKEHNAVIAIEQELTFTDSGNVATSESLVLAEQLVAGSTYRVAWGDKGYVCRCYDKVESGGVVLEGALLGNASLFLSAMPDTGEPFYIGVSDKVVVIKRGADATTTIAIYGGEEMASKVYVQEYVEYAVTELASVIEPAVAQYVEQYISEALGGDY